VTYFYISAIGIVCVAILFTFYPLIVRKLIKRGDNQAKNPIEVSNANVIKQRIVELENEVNEGLIDPAEKDNAIRDLKLALVDEMPLQKQRTDSTNGLLMLALTLPAVLIGTWVYWQSNQIEGLIAYNDSTLEIADLRKKLEEQGPQSLTPDDFAKFALSIRSNLRKNPDDVRGWSFLAMVNTSIGRVEEGIAAYKKALDLTPQDDALRFKYAEALMLQGTEESLQNSARQLDYLIRAQPENRNNRLLITSVAIQLQDTELAVNQFEIIKKDMNPNSQFYQSIVLELRKLGVNDVAIVGDITASTNDVDTNGNAPQVSSNQQNDSKNQSTELLINVNISDELKARLPENAYLIVFAQHSDGRSRAPLAVKRFKLPQLPIQLSLSDQDAMIPAMNLSSASIVNVTARISLDEDVMPKAGELEGSTVNVELAKVSASIDVAIDKILP
jgi:cytochrome c-type biogenesis protein CcmH